MDVVRVGVYVCVCVLWSCLSPMNVLDVATHFTDGMQ